MIVVFHDDIDFSAFVAAYHADDRAAADPVAWNYLDAGVTGFVQELEGRLAFRAEHVYSHSIRGFAARLTAAQIITLRNDPDVAYVEPDQVAYAVAQTLPWGIDKIGADVSSTRAGDGRGAITNIHAYIIDTGIDTTHRDLNVVKHVNFTRGDKNKDCHGHGTHVAGIVGAKDNTQDVVGVAPGLPLVGVKVLGCDGWGTASSIIKGVDWVTAKADKPAVANMSVISFASDAIDHAVVKSANSGIFYAVAAGNSSTNACNYSPARAGTHDGVMTVAATTGKEKETSWSNYGDCVDIWAPGASILSTRMGGGVTLKTGTSMASPHVAGGGVLFLSSQGNASPAVVENALKSAAVNTHTKSKNDRPIKRLSVRFF